KQQPAYNVTVSNVRGPGQLWLAGRPVTELKSLGPLTGRLGLNLTAWSYGDDFTIGLHATVSSGVDLDALGRCLTEELGDLRSRAQADPAPTENIEASGNALA